MTVKMQPLNKLSKKQPHKSQAKALKQEESQIEKELRELTKIDISKTTTTQKPNQNLNRYV